MWHQRFELGDGAYAPGVSDVEFPLDVADIPRRTDGKTVLDIGTTNGGSARRAVRRRGLLGRALSPAPSLLALDNVRRLARGRVSIETAVSYHLLAAEDRKIPLARFFRGAEHGGDSSNWFAPNVAALRGWCESRGLEPTHVRGWPDPPARATVIAFATEPEWPSLSYEQPLSGSV